VPKMGCADRSSLRRSKSCQRVSVRKSENFALWKITDAIRRNIAIDLGEATDPLRRQTHCGRQHLLNQEQEHEDEACGECAQGSSESCPGE
jgi:hypothetical protein